MVPLPRLSTGLCPRPSGQPSFYRTACLLSTFSHDRQSSPTLTPSQLHVFLPNSGVVGNYLIGPT